MENTQVREHVKYSRKGNIIERYYTLNNKYHRENGPAIIDYYDNGQVVLERYYVNDKCHREDGPAIIRYDMMGNVSSIDYFLNGTSVNVRKYNNTNYDQIKKFIHLRRKLDSLLELQLIINVFITSIKERNELIELLDSKILLMKLTKNF